MPLYDNKLKGVFVMNENRKYYITVGQEDFTRVDEILRKFYDQGYLEDATVEFVGSSGAVILGLECSMFDRLLIAETLKRAVL